VNEVTFPDDIAALKQIIADRDALISQLEERNRLLQAILYVEQRAILTPS